MADLRESRYYEYLYSNFKPRSLIARHRGKKSCTDKTTRVLRICDWLERTKGDFSGLTSYLGRDSYAVNNNDYPLAIRLDSANEIQSFVQLDGSHRRCVAAYLGHQDICSMVVNLETINKYVMRCEDEYILNHWSAFADLVKALNLYQFTDSSLVSEK